MPISLTPFSHDPLCYGSSWGVRDETLLAEQIARVALGQSRHVAKILAGAGLAVPSTTTSSATTNAISMLTVAAGSDAYHRDGWMFQVMSWIAAYCATPDGLIRAPHMIFAHKGLDGLQLILDEDGQEVSAAVIFEDKATDNPRNTIRDEVWPDFQKMEGGDRENVLIADVTALLSTQTGMDIDAAIQNIVWKQIRHYRVSITVGDTHNSNAGRARLFKDYDGIIAGDIGRRRSETFFIADLRPWMNRLAGMAITFLQSMEGSDV